MEQLSNGFTLDIPSGAFPLSTDSMALAHFVKLKRDASVLDLGSGCGTLGVLLCAEEPGCTVTGIELDPAAHTAALDNAGRNGLTGRLQSICGDLRQIAELVIPGSFSCCVSNPPYFSGGPASAATPDARREDHCTLDDLVKAAAWGLKFGGDFYLVHRPERLAQICACASQAGLEPKRLQLLRHRAGCPVTLILLQCRKGGKPGLIWEENCLFDAAGQPTPYYHSIYHTP